MRERDGVIDTLHSENRELSAQLAAQSQARLNVADKLDIAQASLSTAEADATSLRARVQDLEQRLSNDQRSLLAAENQFRDQVTERNTLLLTIYQYMDKILGVDKTPVRYSVRSHAAPSLTHPCSVHRRKLVRRRRNHTPTLASSTIT
jgi:chromosome segregation ATPase